MGKVVCILYDDPIDGYPTSYAYAAGTREILECYFEGRPIRDEYLIVQNGKLAGAGAHSYKKGDVTGGSQ